MQDRSEMGNFPETKESKTWRGEFGSHYSERNLLNPPELDKMYQGKYGVTRTALNQDFLTDIPRSASILEVGCNLGNQLLLLKQMGFENLSGIEINRGIVKEAQSRVPWARVMEGSALKIPFRDASFDVVFTSGLLIHIAPRDLPVVMSEIHRCARNWIWGLEYYATEATEVMYRGRPGLLWKADYVRFYTESFPDLELAMERKLSYLENDNVDSMFLLRRRNGSN
ncbi:MAG: pseudaminic acid biosynthesis-associated methylase [Terriglobales bacterium]